MRFQAYALGVLVFVAGQSSLAADRPVAVSPGSAGQIQMAEACPTFSWASVDAATGYQLTVYNVTEKGALGEEAVRKRLPAGVTTWTPAADGCLPRGSTYAWMVGAIGKKGEVLWSEPVVFRVTPVPSERDFEEALAVVRQYLTVRNGAEPGAARVPELGAELGLESEGETWAVRATTEAASERVPVPYPGFLALRAETVGIGSPSSRARTPGSASLTVDAEIHLGSGSDVFKDGEVFLWSRGESLKVVTALGQSALAANRDGNLNSAFGAYALRLNDDGSQNTAVGHASMVFNSSGSNNTAVGSWALYGVIGHHNTGVGAGVLYASGIDSGYGNTGIGADALRHNRGGDVNTAVGYEALRDNGTGNGNVAFGWQALWKNIDGFNNTALGTKALQNNTGSSNVAIGNAALLNKTIGARNIAIGDNAGADAGGGSDNIFLGHHGFGGDSHVTRIGTAFDNNGNTDPTDDTGHERVFIAGIWESPGAGTHYVRVDEEGRLGTGAAVSSSRRFKRDIGDMGERSASLLDLHPVTFRWNEAASDDEGSVGFGLVAEEVAEVLPELVDYDSQGRPHAVRYLSLTPLLLNELQKQHRRVQVQGWLLSVILLAGMVVTIGRRQFG